MDGKAEKEHTVLTFMKVMLIQEETATVLAWKIRATPPAKDLVMPSLVNANTPGELILLH